MELKVEAMALLRSWRDKAFSSACFVSPKWSIIFHSSTLALYLSKSMPFGSRICYFDVHDKLLKITRTHKARTMELPKLNVVTHAGTKQRHNIEKTPHPGFTKSLFVEKGCEVISKP